MPGLLTLKTDLKSLKYGQDRPGGGDSGQPYIKTDINTVDRGFNQFRLTRFDDGLIRGGAIGALNASVVDTLRIGKFFTDPPKGPLFLIKQIELQLSNPRLETRALPNINVGGFFGRLLNAGINFLNNNSIGPTRIYNLGVNTLAQIPVNAFGGHIVRHGLTPIPNENSYYINVVRDNNKTSIISSQLINTATTTAFTTLGLGRFAPRLIPDTFTKNIIASSNRLIKLTAKLNLSPRITGTPDLSDKDPNIITQYLGGPESLYGIIGNTIIKRHGSSTQKESWTANNYAVKEAKEEGKDKNKLSIDNLNKNLRRDTVENGPSSYPSIPVPVIPTSVYGNMKTYAEIAKANQLTNTNVQNVLAQTAANVLGGPLAGALATKKLPPVNQFKIIASGSDGHPLKVNGSIAYSTSNPGNIIYQNWNGEKFTISGSWTWDSVSREKRVGSGRQDQINLTPIFSGVATDANGRPIVDKKGNFTNQGYKYFGEDKVTIKGKTYYTRDLVKFRIQAVNTNSPNNGDWMVFRAYLTQFSDNIDAAWNDVKYAGRGDKLYVYDGFTRKIQIGFKVAALSAAEMKPMYQKLNYLMSNLMPDYGGVWMRGPLTRMTVGNYLDSQLGVLTSLSYTIPNDSPWEIALDEPEGGIKQLILPHIIEVSLAFTPIGAESKENNRLPEKSQTISYLAQNNTGKDVKTLQYV